MLFFDVFVCVFTTYDVPLGTPRSGRIFIYIYIYILCIMSSIFMYIFIYMYMSIYRYIFPIKRSCRGPGGVVRGLDSVSWAKICAR